MIQQFLSASFNLGMLPTRLAIRNTKATFRAMRDLPGTMKQCASGLHRSCGDSQLFIDQLMQRIDAELGGDPVNLSNHEREIITARELAMAEQHIGHAMFNMLKAYRVLSAKPSRVIEYGRAERID
jgi:hypothetical protein